MLTRIWRRLRSQVGGLLNSSNRCRRGRRVVVAVEAIEGRQLLATIGPDSFPDAFLPRPQVTIRGVQVAPMTFFGENLNPNENIRLDVHPQADAARDQFLAHLAVQRGQEDFEDITLIPRGTRPPLLITFSAPGAPTDTATLLGNGIVNGPPFMDPPPPLLPGAATETYQGRFSITPPSSPQPPPGNYFDSQSNFSIQFSTPLAAFGFYGTDIGDQGIGSNLNVVLETLNDQGTVIFTRDIPVLQTTVSPAARRAGNVVYFGVITTETPFSRVRFRNVGSPGIADFFGFDNFTIARREEIVGASIPAVSLVKRVNGDDANLPPGQSVAVPGPLNFTYEVRNTGNVTLSNLVVRDDNATPGDLSDDFTVGTLVSLAPGVTTTLTAVRPALAGPHQNTGTVTGTDASTGTTVTATDVANYFGAAPAVSLVKRVNGDDASSPPGPSVAVPGPLSFTYEVRNTGNVTLSNLVVRDDNATPGDPSDDFTVGTLVSLAPGVTTTLTAVRPALAGPNQNTGTATGTDDSTGTTVTATDVANYFGTAPAVSLVKLTNGTNNDAAPGLFLPVGSAATFTYTVANTGNVPLALTATVNGVVVPNAISDDAGTPLVPTDDVASPTVLGAGGVIVGDDGDGVFEPGETWQFAAPAPRTVTAGQYTNVGTVTGTPPGPLPPITVNNPDNHFGANPNLSIVKLTNGTNNDTLPGPIVPVGSTVTFTYIVTNTGNVPLSGVTVTDDRGVTPILQSGDTNANGLLDITETWTFTASRNATSGPYTNVGTATGTPPPGGGPAVSDSDPDNHSGLFTSAGIDIVKLTNGTDNPTAPGPFIPVGGTVTFTYVVTNTGNQPLSNVVVRDDNGTPIDPSDDFNAPFAGGDSNANGGLDPDPDGAGPQAAETWTFTASRPAVTGQRTNLGIVTALPPVGGIPSVTDTDLDNDFGSSPGIDIVKLTNGTDNDTPPGPTVPAGSTVTFTYIVTNTGNVPLTNVTVVDDNGTPGITADDVTLAIPGTFAIGAATSLTATRVATAGQYTNIATVTGTPPIGSPVTDSNPDNHFGVAPAISLVKLTNGTNNDDPTTTGPLVLFGSTVSFTYNITNTGNVPLINVTLVDDNGTPGTPADDLTLTLPGTLASGATATLTATRIATAGQYTNIATVTGTSPVGTLVSADNPDRHFGSSPGISLVNLTNGTNNDDPATTGPIVRVGDTVTFTYNITNTGNVPLINVTLVDDNGTPGNTADDVTLTVPGTLAAGATTALTATRIATAGQYINSATATGTPPVGTPVSATNPDRHFGQTPSSLAGSVYFDNNNNGVLDPAEPGIGGVLLTLSGTDVNNVAVGLTSTTAADGSYSFAGLLSGIYTVTETQPAAFNDGLDAAGTSGGVVGNDVISAIPLAAGTNAGAYTFGETGGGIDIVKLTNGTDNNIAPGPFILAGTAVTFTYNVTNTGNVPLTNVTVVDDSGTPGNTADDLTLTVPGTLAVGATATLTATRIATAGPYTNIATATGTPPAGLPVSASDADNHFGSSPVINIVTLTNDTNNDTPPGPIVQVGSTVTFTYIVTNAGNVPLSGVSVTDDRGVTPVLQSGDTNTNGLLDITETWTFTASRGATSGLYTNVGTATGSPPPGGGPAVSDSDPDHHSGFITSAGIDIVKLTNGTDNPLAPGPLIPVGSTVIFTYVVTNTGNQPLSNVVVRDDNGTPSDPTDDFNALLVGGDSNGNGVLDPDTDGAGPQAAETWTFTASRPVVTGQRTNLGIVTALPPVGGIPSVTDTDLDNDFGSAPGINVVKLTNGTDNDTPPGLIVPVGSTVTFTYIVTNTGNVPLSGISVTDDRGVTPVLQGGDTNANGLLDITETWTFTATTVATPGPYTNVGTATGTPPVGSSVTDTNADNHFGRVLGGAPGIALVTLTNGQDTGMTSGPLVLVGSTVRFTYVVTSIGNEPLSRVTVVDDNGTPGDTADDFNAAFAGGDTDGDGLLDPFETFTFTASRIATVGQFTNNATATGLPPLGPAVTDSDPSNHEGCSLTVTNAGDSGPGSLRDAITCANLIAGPDRIDFAIPGQGPFTIRLASALPEITESLVIDGYTQPGSRPNTREVGDDAVLLIVLNGAAAGPDAVGLRIPAAGSGSTVRGLVIRQFNEVGIRLRGSSDTLVAGNFLGTDAAGTRGPGAGLFGVLIQGGSGNTIGGTTPAARNVISGHRSVGVRIFGNSQRNVVQGNFIGTDSNGTAALANAFDGVFIDGGPSGNTIGGTASGAGNVISGNGSVGVQIFGASGNVVQGNRIGTDATGSSPLGNNDGVFLNRATGNTIGGTAPGAGNLISASSFVGVQILGPGSSGNVVEGNRIGTDADGNTRPGFGNRFGLFLNAAPGNTIGQDNIIRGNSRRESVSPETLVAVVQDARSIADGPVVAEVVLTFSQDMHPARVQDRRNYRLRPAGRGRMIAIESATYDPLTRSVTLRLREPFGANVSLRLMVNGTSRRGVADARDRLLDGNGDGRPGGNFVTRLGSPATSRTPVETAESGVIPLPGSPQGPARGRISARAVDHLLRSEGLSAPSRPPRPRAIPPRR